MDINELWNKSSSEKKNYILSFYGISYDMMQKVADTDLMILSQPFVEDCGLSEQEMIDIYAPYISKAKTVVIKTHPRDGFDYETYFPNAYILRSKAPMQLLNIIGMVPKVAIAVCSTALSGMPDFTKKIFLGTKVNSKIFAVYGDLYN